MWIKDGENFPVTNSSELVHSLLMAGDLLSGDVLKQAIAGERQACSLLIVVYDDESGQGNVEVGDCDQLIDNTDLIQKAPKAVFAVDELFVDNARHALDHYRQR